MERCNTLFCIAERHEDDQHVDATGATWTEALSDSEVLAHVLTINAGGNEGES